MRYYEIICERGGTTAEPYPYHFVEEETQTHEFGNHGARFKHPLLRTIYAFDSDNGKHYLVHFKLQEDTLELSFTTLGGGHSLNGAGDAPRILATVAAIATNYIAHENPETITFSARRTEPSRVKLYDFIANRTSNFFPGYHFASRKPYGYSMNYTLQKD